MSEITQVHGRLMPSTKAAIEKVRELTANLQKFPQLEFVTDHLLHGGMYARTVVLPANAVCTAVLVKPPTVLIVAGDVDVWSNDEVIHVTGYTVLPGSALRKIAFVTHSFTGMTMTFPSKATTVEEAQREFTDEFELLVPLSLEDRHRTTITGE